MCKEDADKVYAFTACPTTEARADTFFAAEHHSQSAVLNQPLLKRARQFNIDLTPQLLYSRGEFVDLLVRSAVSKYLEFRCLDTTYTYVDQRFQRVPCTKSEVFGSDLLSMIEKRLLMKLSHVVFGAAGEDPHAQDAVNKSDLQRMRF
jgi:RAB protein geranylgeranyltransferase component A